MSEARSYKTEPAPRETHQTGTGLGLPGERRSGKQAERPKLDKHVKREWNMPNHL
ncbi:hypothetical protein ABENE_13050 [Asticcacaulis benevestitus DSM 16100 = ATCC BAA-896]|uniref:Uncharacterized protein n=1 Tax=Asticcacaulis benevestitus DSM 16100 = ATCC BAA-896 TaxID=1121022 RepID=V4PNR6_9CAUL|nr:hypothetical protein ABENE_13050 [Asticcacaulis benevestitus DSM 16100 = ATCC BAA-896]